MCSKIPWSTFLLAVAVLLLGYYLVVGVLFYRKDLMTWFARRRRGRSATVSDTELSRDTDRAGEPSA